MKERINTKLKTLAKTVLKYRDLMINAEHNNRSYRTIKAYKYKYYNAFDNFHNELIYYTNFYKEYLVCLDPREYLRKVESEEI